MSLEDVRSSLSRIPALDGIPPELVRLSPLGGLTNTNFKLDTPIGSFVLQLPSTDQDGVLNRTHTIEASRMAASLGIGAEVIHADMGSGVIVTRWVEGGTPMSAERFRSEPLAIGSAAFLLQQLHRSRRPLGRIFDPFDAIRRYRDALPENPRSSQLVAAADRAETELGRPTTLAPIHGDPVPENFLATHGNLVLIDWEYAGMGDAAWDLAYLALEAEFAPPEEGLLLANYGDSLVTMERLRILKMVAAILAGLWGMLRAQRRIAPDLSGWTQMRLRQARELSNALYPAIGEE